MNTVGRYAQFANNADQPRFAVNVGMRIVSFK